ncbi:class I SAM-dependent methyltransferase family protein [Candidatus Woesearchaeota archaeon]|nr:MAG: class I SAM-dependent methyltransferase family protein [Candidatus Woesearchaeota archaeon]
MIAAKVPKKHAQKAREEIIRKNLLNKNYKITSDKDFVYFPLTEKAKIKNAQITSKRGTKLKKAEKPRNLKQALKGVLTKKELAHLKTSFDVVGSIAIMEIDPALVPKEKTIAQKLLEINPAIKTVLKKAGAHEGRFRTQKLKHLAGKRTKEACVRENNVTLCLNVEKVYFSVRLATERKRIASLVNPGEKVLVMFSGCGPYTCVIAKNTQAKKVVGVELNPEAHKYAQLNIKQNKLEEKAEAVLGDARESHLLGKFDRILMPLPKSAEEFLDAALLAAKSKTTIHLYTFGSEEELEDRKKQVRQICRQHGKRIRIIHTERCGQFSPKVYRWCIDFRLL